MSYPPNSAAVIRRSPQHGIRIAGDPTAKPHSPSSSSSPLLPFPQSSGSWSSIPTNARTIICAEAHCNNRIDVVPHGFDAGLVSLDSTVYIKARCKECEPLVTVPIGWEGHAKAEQEEQQWDEASSDDWVDNS